MLGDPGVLDPGTEGEVGAPGVGAPPPGDPNRRHTYRPAPVLTPGMPTMPTFHVM